MGQITGQKASDVLPERPQATAEHLLANWYKEVVYGEQRQSNLARASPGLWRADLVTKCEAKVLKLVAGQR